MDTLGKRVKRIIVYHGSTMTRFAKDLNISQSMVSKICSDKATPSDRTIADICRVFNINREWLLKGEGAMTDVPSLEAEMREMVAFDPEDSQYNETLNALISALASIPPIAWVFVKEYVDGLARYQNDPDGKNAYRDGYKDGIRMAQEIGDMVANLPTELEE